MSKNEAKQLVIFLQQYGVPTHHFDDTDLIDLQGAIDAYAERQSLLARKDELRPISFRVKDALSVSSGPRTIVRTHLVDEFIDKRLAEIDAQLNTLEKGGE